MQQSAVSIAPEDLQKTVYLHLSFSLLQEKKAQFLANIDALLDFFFKHFISRGSCDWREKHTLIQNHYGGIACVKNIIFSPKKNLNYIVKARKTYQNWKNLIIYYKLLLLFYTVIWKYTKSLVLIFGIVIIFSTCI